MPVLQAFHITLKTEKAQPLKIAHFKAPHNSPIYDECQTQSAWALALP